MEKKGCYLSQAASSLPFVSGFLLFFSRGACRHSQAR